MKLLVLIGTDYHLNQLPHFLAHYAGIGVDTFVCGLHGHRIDQALALLAPYPHVIVADYGTERYDQVANSHWVTHFNDFRRDYVQPGEWCLFADVDEFHEYEVDFFADLDPQINAIRGSWVERLATSDGQLLPCLPEGNIGQQFPFATREIFCGISQKIMAVRADLELTDGYHWIKGGTARPVYFPQDLNVHHFRWDDRAASKYKDVKWTRHYQITNGRVPDLRGVFAVDPPFPPAPASADHRNPAMLTTRDAQNDARSNGTAPGKLAYLIIAHHQPNHLARLIHALNDTHSYFFIHIDAKVPLAPFQAVVPQHANIIWLPNRVAVEWGRLSVVQAVLNLIQTAAATGYVFNYYTLLSGSDYPIKHKQEIFTRLQTSDRQFLRIDRKLTNDITNSHRHFINNLPQGTYFGNLTPYHGSMYWSLSAECIRFILDFVQNNPGYVEIHNHMFAPDEVFFHTIVKHSPFAEAITHDFSDGIYPNHTHHANHFIDWEGRRNRTNLTLDERDVDDLLASPALFARKFDQQTSSRLLDLLDTQIHFARTPQLLDRKDARASNMKHQPAVSCICLTYARPELLEEAIHSFLVQDYPGPKELIVLNDYAGQTLVFDHPEVRVINLPLRFRTVGEKRNAAIALASHNLLFVWDDDDIYLPHRLTFSLEHFDARKGFFKPDKAWFWNDGALCGPEKNLFHASSCWLRDRFDAVRGYDGEGSGHDDLFERRLAQRFPGSTATFAIQPADISYIYRWHATGFYHLSGFGGLKRGENSGNAEVAAYIQQRADRGEIRQGRIPLQPGWKTDYRQLVSNYLAAQAAASQPVDAGVALTGGAQ